MSRLPIDDIIRQVRARAPNADELSDAAILRAVLDSFIHDALAWGAWPDDELAALEDDLHDMIRRAVAATRQQANGQEAR